jgi:hypothetical protein
MASYDRQNSLLLTEDWSKIYRSFTDADFSAYDFPTIRRTMINYLRKNYPEDFNDYIESSEYLALIDVIAFLGQSLAFRVDLNSRENFIETAEKKESVLRLARLVGYNNKRNIAGSGILKITGVQTTENLSDSSGVPLRNRFITWNDDSNVNWLEQTLTIMNNAFSGSVTFGKPNASEVIGGIQTDLYKVNSNNTDVPVFTFDKTINGTGTTFNIVSAKIDSSTISEETPLPGNTLGVLYRNDKKGNSSENTGFFLHFKQGELISSTFDINDPSNNEIINLNTPNINNSDVWLWELDQFGNFNTEWTKLESTIGSNAIYNSVANNNRKIYTVVSRDLDQVSLNFADGNFGDLPNGRFRTYYRVSNGLSYLIRPADMQNIVVEVPYVSKSGQENTLILQCALQSTVTNATATESVDAIKVNAPQAYYSQNRMVTGEDYNTLPLTSNPQIVKAKAVNRASSGISRQYEIKDPTGKYSSTNIMADDGIMYKNDFEVDFSFTFSTRNDILGVLRNTVEPIIAGIPTKSFYYDKFPRVVTSGLNIDWVKSTDTSSGSTGYFRNTVNGAPITVGTFTGNNFKFIATDAMIKFVPPAGRYFLPNGELTTTKTKTTRDYIWTKVTNVVGDGSNGGLGALDDDTGPIILSETVPSLATPSEIIPNIVTDLPSDIETEIVDLVFNYKSFGIRYDQSTLTWKIITNANVNTVDPFSLDREGDISGTKSDKSWFVLFETDGETYTVTYRGLDYRFESENLVQFYVDARGKTYDPKTGKVIKDQIKVLKVNEDPTTETILTKDYEWEITGSIRSTDGFEETNRVQVNLYDSDDDGMVDDPDSFINIVAPDSTDARGYRDKFVFFQNTLVDNVTVAKKIDASNFVIFDNETSIPALADYTNGQLFYFYGSTENIVKSYNSTTGALDLENSYFAKPGRDNIKFQYLHNAENDRRLDPSKTNIIDLYVLTESYDNAYRFYIANGGAQPSEPTSEQLRSEFEPELEKVKSISDTMIFHTVKYRELFGANADTDLQAQFKLVRSQQSAVSDNQLKSSVISAINEFFDVQNWDFGDTFFFTELATYVHNQLAPDLANIVIVPRSNSQSFGSLFQIQSKADEIFISSATVDNVEIIDSLTAANLQASGNVVSSIEQVGTTAVTSANTTRTTTTTASTASTGSSSSSSGTSSTGGSSGGGYGY